MLDPNGGGRHRQRMRTGLWPFDEHDRVVEVRLEIPPLRGGDVAKAEEVEVRDVHTPVVAVADGEGGARDRLRDAERPGPASDEGRLAGAELAGDGDHVADAEVCGELGGEPLGLRG